MFDSGSGEGSDEKSPSETEEGSDDDVFGDFSVGGVLDITEAEDGLGGDEESDSCGVADKDKEEDEGSFEIADDLATVGKAGEVVAYFLRERLSGLSDEVTAGRNSENDSTENGECGEKVSGLIKSEEAGPE